MKLQVFTENEWVYPDGDITEVSKSVYLETARNANISFQVLTDFLIDDDTPISIDWSGENLIGLSLLPYQLMPVLVGENSGAEIYTTLDYDSVKEFVTRKAPFYVYDVTRDIDNGLLKAGRLALYFRIVVSDELESGNYESVLKIGCGGYEAEINISLRVYKAIVPKLSSSHFDMTNWLFLRPISKAHNVSYDSDEFWEIVGNYMENQLDLRSNHLMLSRGEPIHDSTGRIIDFDFSEMVYLGNMALDKGYSYIYGGFVSHWKDWAGTDLFLLWDMETECITQEAYRQLKIYFTKLWKTVQENGWESRYMQCLVDEPNFPNSEHYRILSCICRKFMPGVIINDPVESTELGGAVDIWVVKQSLFEKYIDTYRDLQEIGEKMWIYTCGFPAGKTMNRVLDLSLMASRLPMWMCYKYNAPGFLHWGYNYYSDNPFEYCCSNGKRNSTPAGNNHIVYPDGDKPWHSVRGHLQRSGAEDYELLYQLGSYNREKAEEIIAQVCTSFYEYNPSAINFDEARHKLLERLEAFL